MSMGHVYDVPKEIATIQTHWGEQTQLAFAGNTFEFMPLKATPETAAAFGMTLVKAGQAVEVQATQKKLSQIEYHDGMLAGHFFPYDPTQINLATKTLYPFVITDLEHHDFSPLQHAKAALRLLCKSINSGATCFGISRI